MFKHCLNNGLTQDKPIFESMIIQFFEIRNQIFLSETTNCELAKICCFIFTTVFQSFVEFDKNLSITPSGIETVYALQVQQ